MANEQKVKKIYVCDTDFSEREVRGYKLDGQWILILKFQGSYHAMDASCAHSGYPLFKGTIDEKGVLTCPLHYAQFNCQTGAIVSEPPICPNQDLFDIAVEDNKIYWLK